MYLYILSRQIICVPQRSRFLVSSEFCVKTEREPFIAQETHKVEQIHVSGTLNAPDEVGEVR